MFKDRLRSLRENSGLTQREFGEKFNLSDARYNQYETGKRMPDYEILLKFADFFGVSIDYLLRGKNYNKEITKEEEIAEKIKEDFLKIIEENPELKNMLDDPIASERILKNIESFNRQGINLTMEMLLEFAANKLQEPNKEK